MKAVIVDLLGGYAAALRDDGRVVKLPDAGYTLGQVIEVHERARSSWRRSFLSIAAAAALLLGIGGAAYAIPYGTVTLDADSSIQYTINLFDYVLDVQASDEEGEALLAELDLRQVRHRRVDSAITSTVEQIEQRGYWSDPEAAISVSADTRSERHTERLRQELERTVSESRPAPEDGQRPDSPGGNPDAMPGGSFVDQPGDGQAPGGQQSGEAQDFAGGDNPPEAPQGEPSPLARTEPPGDAPREEISPALPGSRGEDPGLENTAADQTPANAEGSDARFPAAGEAFAVEEAPAFDSPPAEQSFGAPDAYAPAGPDGRSAGK